MATKKEDVLMEISDVRHKGVDGVLYVMNERLALMTNNRVAVSIHFSDIKMQKISPVGKPKIQLQIVGYDSNSTIFQFVNRQGEEAQIKSRDELKDLINSLLPNFRREVDKEMQEKSKVLAENPKLLQLYKDLVTSQIITSDEFWKSYSNDMKGENKKEEVAVSASFLSEIKPVTDGCNGIRYNLTPETIECIFKTYPSVKKIYTEKVPRKLSESDFWIQFFHSHYFHKDRIVSGFKDIFNECGKVDDMALKLAIHKNLGDPLLDLTRFGDNTIEEDYCSSSNNDGRRVEKSDNIVTQSIIKRFNHHSFMILKTTVGESAKEYDGILKSLSSTESGNKKQKAKNVAVESICDGKVLTEEEIEEQKKMKAKRIMEKIHYEDLVGDGKTDSQENVHNSIRLDKLERYLYGPMLSDKYANGNSNGINIDEIQTGIQENIEESSNNRTPHTDIIKSTDAVVVLGELSPGGLLMQHYQDHDMSSYIPINSEKDIRNMYIAGRELLKRFWICFPITDAESLENASKIHECLNRFNIAKIKPLEETIARDLAPLGAKLFHHLNKMFQIAFEKFALAADRKSKKK